MPRVDFNQGAQPITRPQASGTTTAKAATAGDTAATSTFARASFLDQAKFSNLLTEEEKGYIEMKLLPANYGELKACLKEKGLDAAKQMAREGKRGPFTGSYGDPKDMLATAKRIAKNPELSRLAQDIKKGVILIQNWNCETVVSDLTKGPFIHAMICSSDGPPPDFIEAYGIPGTSGNDGNTGVRRAPLSSTMYDGLSVRLMRPAEKLQEPERSKAIDRAVEYAEDKLGLPYDYAMTNNNYGEGSTNAFYCSELAYLAYVDPKGANMKLPVSKSPERDQMIVSLNSIIASLKPNGKAELAGKAMTFMSKSPAPTSDELIDFLVDEVMPSCKTTEEICTSSENRDRLKSTIKEIMEGKAFPDFDKATQNYQAREKNGDFDGFFGWAKRLKAHASTAAAFSEDLVSLVRNSGADISESLQAVTTIAGAFLPHAETLANFLWGSKDSKTQSISSLMDKMDWLKSKDIPLISDHIPGRAQNTIQTDFVSPTDLALADAPAYDYNVKADK
jgi:hypothetical protein